MDVRYLAVHRALDLPKVVIAVVSRSQDPPFLVFSQVSLLHQEEGLNIV